MYTIIINSKTGQKKVVHPSPMFGLDERGSRLSKEDMESKAKDIAFDSFGLNVLSVELLINK